MRRHCEHRRPGSERVASRSGASAGRAGIAHRQVCNRFETAWQSGEEPRIDDYLDGASQELRSALLGELVLIDVHYRAMSNRVLTLADYLGRHPDLDETWLSEALASYQTGESGERTSRAGPVTIAETRTTSSRIAWPGAR